MGMIVSLFISDFNLFLHFFTFFCIKIFLFFEKVLTNAEWMVIITEHGSLVKRLRRRPLTAETRVRFSYGLSKPVAYCSRLFSVLFLLLSRKVIFYYTFYLEIYQRLKAFSNLSAENA